MINNVTFGSTYRIPVAQQGINKAKKARLKALTQMYNGLVGSGSTGYARVSIDNKLDNEFVCKLKTIGYKIFQKFEGEKVPNDQLDAYIKQRLDSRNYQQIGKQMKRISK